MQHLSTKFIKKASNTFDAENFWMRIYYDSEVSAEMIRVTQLGDGDRPQTYWSDNIYQRFKVDADEDHDGDVLELHRERWTLSTSIHITRWSDFMTLKPLQSWLGKRKSIRKEKYNHWP
jgi:hypothetical protein